MKVKNYKLSATIPTGEYANIIPTIEIETDNIEEAHSLAMHHVESLFDKHSVRKLQTKEVSATVKLHSFNEPDIEIDFDPIRHIYTYQGKVLKSATDFVSEYSPKFNGLAIAKACENKWKVSAEDIQALWSSNGRVSAQFGTIVHLALEHFYENKDVGNTIKENSDKTENAALPKHPILKKIIEDFQLISGDNENIVYNEVLVTDVKRGICGRLDRLLMISETKKICRVQDYKINVGASDTSSGDKMLAPFNKLPGNKLTKYQVQMSFYSSMLENTGWAVAGMDAFVLEEVWKKYTLDSQSVIINSLL